MERPDGQRDVRNVSETRVVVETYIDGACVVVESPPLKQPASKPINFPVQDPTNSVMQAGPLTGTLTLRHRCLYVSAEEDKSLVLPVWPHGFSYETEDGCIWVLGAEGDRVAEVGGSFSSAGGLLGEKSGDPLPSPLNERVEPCKGPYWIVGEIHDP